MDTMINKWTAMITETTTGLTALLAAAAVLALGALILLAIFTHDDREKSAKIKTLIWILAALGIFAAAVPLVSRAMSL